MKTANRGVGSGPLIAITALSTMANALAATSPATTMSPEAVAAAANSDNFPRLGVFSTGGVQKYGSNFQTFAAKFHMVVIGGHYEGWQKNAGYSKEQVIQSIKSQSFVSTRVFQYINLHSLYNSTYAANNGLATWYRQVAARNWWLHPVSTAGAPVTDPQNPQMWLVNVGTNVPVDPATALGPYQWAAKYVDDLFHLGRYSGTSSAPSLDGFFLDDVLIDPSNGAGNVANGDWLRIGTTQSHDATTTHATIMAGERTFFTYLSTAWPGSIQLGNAGGTFALAANSNMYSRTNLTLNNQILAGTSTLSGIMQGGDYEHIMGKGYSVETWGGSLKMQQSYQTAMKNFGGARMMLFNQGNVQANGSDPLTFVSGKPASYSPAWQGARYGITAALMNNGYYFADNGTYDEETIANRRWFDEYDNAGAGVGYLGQPVGTAAGSPQTGAWSNGVWKREFRNGVVLWNPKGNGARTVNVSGLLSPSGRTGLKRIAGTQDRTVNNGAIATSVTLKDRDGLILLWTRP